MRAALEITRHKARLMVDDVQLIAFLVLLPVLAMVFFSYGLLPPPGGRVDANGADQAVPGMAVLFGFLVADSVGHGLFREFGWGTWQRLRTGPVGVSAQLFGLVAPYAVLATVQVLVLHAIGALALGMHFSGTVPALLVMATAAGITTAALGMVLVAISRTTQQMSSSANTLAIVLAGISGALTPVERLPGWVQGVAHVTPHYWALQGYRSIVIDGAGLAQVAPNALCLLGIAAVLGVVAIARLRRRPTDRSL